MKILFASLITLAATLSLASEPPKMTVITKGSYRLDFPKMKCPPNAKCPFVSDLILELPLVGCVDTAVVTYKKETTQDGKHKFIISALNVANPSSMKAMCIVAPTATARIRVLGLKLDKQNVEIEFLQDLAQ